MGDIIPHGTISQSGRWWIRIPPETFEDEGRVTNKSRKYYPSF